MSKKRGTASAAEGWFIEFQAAVLKALPRDIGPDVALKWMQNGESLARVLGKALMPGGETDNLPVSNVYSLSVNYGRSVEDGVKAGRYGWFNTDINSANFPTDRNGKAEVVVELIRFNRSISTEDVFKELDKMGFRPAELRELLAFGENYPDVQREFPVVALGSVWRRWGGYRRVSYLGRSGLRRSLDLGWLDGGWSEFYRFAAVCK